MSAYENLKQQLFAEPKIWLVTGEAGFIGSQPVGGPSPFKPAGGWSG
jgi:hypothetical protein